MRFQGSISVVWNKFAVIFGHLDKIAFFTLQRGLFYKKYNRYCEHSKFYIHKLRESKHISLMLCCNNAHMDISIIVHIAEFH